MIIQKNKQKVHEVLIYRELNSFVDVHAANSVKCTKICQNVSDKEQLWLYQMEIFKGQTYCFTRLAFGLNVAPLVMKSIIDFIMLQDKAM